MMRNERLLGFTLIELLVVLVLVAIIARIAVTSYYPYVTKSRRSDGISTILTISLAEERYRSQNATYGTLAQVYGGVTTSPQNYYTLAISNVTATTYTITATAVGNQANDAEGVTSCTPLSLAVSSGTTTKSPAACWPT